MRENSSSNPVIRSVRATPVSSSPTAKGNLNLLAAAFINVASPSSPKSQRVESKNS